MLDLNSPLGLDKKPQKRGGLRSRAFRSFMTGLVILGGLCLAGGAVFAIWQSNQAAFRKTATVEPAQVEVPAVKTKGKTATGNTPPPGSALRGASGQPGPAIIKVTPDMPPGMPGATTGTADGNVVVMQNAHQAGQDQRVAHLPEQALVEQSPTGPLPVRGADGLRPMDAYAVGWSGARGARIALVIGGLVLSHTGSMEAIDKLQLAGMLCFAPTSNSLLCWHNS